MPSSSSGMWPRAAASSSMNSGLIAPMPVLLTRATACSASPTITRMNGAYTACMSSGTEMNRLPMRPAMSVSRLKSLVRPSRPSTRPSPQISVPFEMLDSRFRPSSLSRLVCRRAATERTTICDDASMAFKVSANSLAGAASNASTIARLQRSASSP